METAIYKLDGSETPGFARVELLKKLPYTILGYNLWTIRVLEVIKQSTLLKCKIGQIQKSVSERWLEIER